MRTAMRAPIHSASLPVVLLLAFAVWAGCDSAGEGDTADVSGVVREADSQTPIPGVEVTLGNAPVATTDQSGHFVFRDVPAGSSLTIQASAVGFATYMQRINVQEGGNTHDISMSRKTYYTYQVGPEDTSTAAASFGVYLPPGVPTYRGVLFAVAPKATDSKAFASGGPVTPSGSTVFDDEIPRIRERSLQLAEEYDLALMGAELVEFSQGDDVFTALEKIAEQSGHPELAQAPLLLIGYSWGGCLAYDLSSRHYDRVVGFIAEKGNCVSGGDVGAAKLVPAYLFLGESDTPVPANHGLTRVFETNRAAGALWAVAVDPGAGHTPVDVNLVGNWMSAVLEARLPAAPPPGSPVALNALGENSGWLGNRQTFEIAPFDQYGGDPLQASWLPMMQTAQDWHALVSQFTERRSE